MALAISVVTDLKSRRIPDWVTLPAIALALAYRFFRQGAGDLEHGLISGLISGAGAAGLFSLWALRQKIGWGDVKLMGVVGAAFGWPLTPGALVFISLCSFLQALVTLLWKGQTLGTLKRMVERDGGAPLYIPFAVAIALGSLWAMWWDH
jgi:prepilin peptidase CpaA